MTMESAEQNQYMLSAYDRDSWEKTEIQAGKKLYQVNFKDANGNVIESNYYIDEQQLMNGDYVRYDEKVVQHFDVERYANDREIKKLVTVGDVNK